MLELTDAQCAQLRRNEHDGFVARVRAELLALFPEQQGERNLELRLTQAHDRALAFGLESPAARTEFLYQEAFAPGFSERPAVAAWLRCSGADPEQRGRDLMALASARLALHQNEVA
jgi:hypothetical protein